MGLFFRKRIGLGPLALNLSRHGVGLSTGIRGFHVGMTSSRRPYVSASLPGTGLRLIHYMHGPQARHAISGGGAVSIPHPIGEQHSRSYRLGYLCGTLLFIGLPLLGLWWLVVILMSLR